MDSTTKPTSLHRVCRDSRSGPTVQLQHMAGYVTALACGLVRELLHENGACYGCVAVLEALRCSILLLVKPRPGPSKDQS